MVNMYIGAFLTMSAVALLSFLAIALFIPFFTNDDEDEAEIPVEPETLDGTEGADVLAAGSDQEVSGLGGNDTLTTAEDSDGAIINGDEGNDSLELNGTNATARGGAGDDIIV